MKIFTANTRKINILKISTLGKAAFQVVLFFFVDKWYLLVFCFYTYEV